jgi:hypothetical protein
MLLADVWRSLLMCGSVGATLARSPSRGEGEPSIGPGQAPAIFILATDWRGGPCVKTTRAVLATNQAAWHHARSPSHRGAGRLNTTPPTRANHGGTALQCGHFTNSTSLLFRITCPLGMVAIVSKIVPLRFPRVMAWEAITRPIRENPP